MCDGGVGIWVWVLRLDESVGLSLGQAWRVPCAQTHWRCLWNNAPIQHCHYNPPNNHPTTTTPPHWLGIRAERILYALSVRWFWRVTECAVEMEVHSGIFKEPNGQHSDLGHGSALSRSHWSLPLNSRVSHCTLLLVKLSIIRLSTSKAAYIYSQPCPLSTRDKNTYLMRGGKVTRTCTQISFYVCICIYVCTNLFLCIFMCAHLNT